MNFKIDGALSEKDNFIPSFHRIGCSLYEVSFEQDRASPDTHTHTADSILKSSDVHWCDLNNFELLVQSFYNSVDVTIVLSWHYSFCESFFMKLS